MMQEKRHGGGRSRPTHVTRGNVLDDLGFSPEQATALKFKADLYRAICGTRESIRKSNCR